MLVALGRDQVLLHQFVDELAEAYSRLPAELDARARGIAQQRVDFRWPEITRVERHDRAALPPARLVGAGSAPFDAHAAGVREFVVAAARVLGITIRWKGKGAAEKGYEAKGRCIVRIDPRYFRPAEVDTLVGDAAKARRKLKWRPKVRFAELVGEMVREDLRLAERDELARRHGHKVLDRNE